MWNFSPLRSNLSLNMTLYIHLICTLYSVLCVACSQPNYLRSIVMWSLGSMFCALYLWDFRFTCLNNISVVACEHQFA